MASSISSVSGEPPPNMSSYSSLLNSKFGKSGLKPETASDGGTSSTSSVSGEPPPKISVSVSYTHLTLPTTPYV